MFPTGLRRVRLQPVLANHIPPLPRVNGFRLRERPIARFARIEADETLCRSSTMCHRYLKVPPVILISPDV